MWLTQSKSRKAGLHPGSEEAPIPLRSFVLAPLYGSVSLCACWDALLGYTAVCSIGPKTHTGFSKISHCTSVTERSSEHQGLSISPLYHLKPFLTSFVMLSEISNKQCFLFFVLFFLNEI